MIPLFERYPLLRDTLPFTKLGLYPTPVLTAAALDVNRQCAGISIKQDGVSGIPYGGNKVRKLEFLLGDALAKRKTDVLTFGGAGSNHALATAIYAQRLGLTTHSLLIEQPNSYSLRNNLLRSLETNAKLHHFESVAGLKVGAMLGLGLRLCRGKGLPYLIAPGGSSPVGLLGYVNAAFEMNAQIQAGELEPPDVIYIACGTLGSSVGLALGCKILGLATRICAVAVTDPSFSSIGKAKQLFEKANSLLYAADNSIPRVRFQECALELRHDFFGAEYGRYTREGMAAMDQLKNATGLKIEGCYTGKCLAALLADLRQDRLEARQVLFWNTYDAHGGSHSIEHLDYHQLPAQFHRYFEQDVQLLDKA
jgi:D-cysteine desulfhydrase